MAWGRGGGGSCIVVGLTNEAIVKGDQLTNDTVMRKRPLEDYFVKLLPSDRHVKEASP